MDQVFNVSGLLNTVTSWLYGLIPTGGGLMFMYHHLAGSTSGDEQSAALHKRAQRNVLIGTMVALGGNALIRFLSQFVGR